MEYFISYYDYYQPEAYIAHTDTYIEKDSAVNEEIDRLRHSATAALFERRDVIVVALAPNAVSTMRRTGTPAEFTLPSPISLQQSILHLASKQSRNTVSLRRP